MARDQTDPWLTMLDEGRAEVLARIQRARRMSDEGVLSAGERINGIVQQARAYIQETETELQATDEAALESLVEQVRTRIVGQHARVKDALARFNDISRAGQAIDGAAHASRLLALNARVEASRLSGENGAAFNVIADEVRALSDQISRANKFIEDVIDELLNLLPSIAGEADVAEKLVADLCQRQRSQAEDLQRRMEVTTDRGKKALDRVLADAYGALSDLQFQDPMIQDIEGIDRVLVGIRNAMAESEQAVQAAYAPILSEETTDSATEGPLAKDAGEILLF